MKQILSASMFKREDALRLATLLLLIAALLGTALQSRAATINVPGDQPTIAAAIAAAVAGDVVQLTAPISEGLVTINKAITLNGGGFTLTSSSVTWGVNPTVPGVTILNLTVTGAGTFGIITAPGAGNLVITNTTVSNCGGTGFAFNCVNELTLTNITATNNGGNGVSITDCNNVSINGITTSGNAFGGGFSAGIGIFSGGGFCTAGTSNVTVIGTVNIGEPLALYEQASSGTITGTSMTPSSGSTSAPTHFAGIANAQKYYATNLATAYTIAASLMAAPSSVPPALVHVEELSSGNKYVNDLLAPAPPQMGTYTLSINAAITYAVAGKTVFIEDGTYNERVTVSKSIALDGQSEAATVLDGTGLVGAGSGISLSNAITDVSIKDLTIRNYAGTSPNSFAGIYAVGGNNNLTVEECKIHDNVGGSGFYANGPVDNVSLDNLEIYGHTSAFGAARGIVIWNGLKSNISITNCEVYNNNCCGIELQDGTATSVTMSNNNIYNNGDNGIGIVGMQGPGANVLSNNTLTNNGRFGIEVKNPDGSGANSGAGSIVVSGNTVTRNVAIVDARDIAGIAVMRRGVLPGNVDVPTGVVVSGNTVSGYVQPSNSEGFGIVIGGTNHSVTGNTVSGNDVGIQQQAGHLPYPADGDQSNLADQFFGRDNSPATCGNDISGNTLSSNGVDTRNVPASIASLGSVLNTTTNITYCSIQAAIDAAATLSGHTLEVSPATYDEQVIVNKGVTIKGVGLTQPSVDFTGTVSGKPTLFDVTADGVSIENMRFNVDMSKLRSAIIVSGVSIDNISIKDNTIDAYGTPAGSYGDRNAVSVNYSGSTNYRVAAGGVNSVTFTGNTINGNTTPPGSFFRSGISADEVGGTFSDNTSQTINHDILLRFGGNGNITIDNNTCNGGGIEVAEHNAGAGTISITNNDFDGTFGNAAVTPRTALLRLKNNQQNKATTVSGNTFVDHRFGLSIENYPNVTVDDNTFSPESGSTDYVHIGVNTKSISSNSNTIVQTTVSGAFTNNVFNGTTPAGGTALGFYNHDSDNAAFGAFTIGTAGNENEFNANIAQFIRLDNQTGSSNGATTPTTYPTTGGWTTTMACWNQNYDVRNNTFDVGAGLQSPQAMSLAQRTLLEGGLFHKPDASCTGLLSYFLPVHNLTQNTFYSTIQAAVTAANANDVIECAEWLYNEKVTVNKSLTIQGVDKDNCIVDGTSLGNGSGFTLTNGTTDVTIKNLSIRNHAGTSPNSFAGIYAVGGNNNLTVEECKIHDNVGGSGFYANGPVDNVSLDNLEIYGHSNAFGAARGIVIWNGLKSNISITNCEVYNNNCCGIELQDGTATGVTMSNNNIYNNGDNGIGIVGMQGPGANVLSNNTLTNNGRFGIEVKNPDGSGANSGAGSIVVSGNTVTRNVAIVDVRDIAGIAVMRRGVLAGNVDIPTGVVVSGNTVSGYVQTSNSEGFGIVIGGTNHTVTGNTVSGNDVGIQQQAGHLPYPADGDQSNLADQFFGRDNSPVTCGNDISGNTLSSNGVDTRNVPASIASLGSVLNTTTNITYCSIQAAIDAAATLSGHTLVVAAGTYSETVNVNKELTIRGAGKGSNPASNTVLQAATACSGTAFTISANNVSLEDMFIKDYNIGVQIGSVSNPVLEDLYIEDHCLYGVSLAGSLAQDISITATNITRTGAPSTTVGIRAGTANGVDGLLVDACSITNNYQGINIAQATTPSLFTDITIQNSTISNNAIKGMYFEKLNNALLKSLTMNNNGTDAGYGFNNGIDINLKYGSYSNISIEDCDITNSGVTGTAADPENPAAIAIKARDDAPSYSGNPATLSNVTLKNNRISGPQNGIRFGEFGKINSSPTGITLEGNDLSHAFANKAIISRINGNIDLECNWHGSTAPATITAGFTTAGSGLINLNAYLSVGTDANPAVGFQPSGLCICPSVNASITGNSLLCSGASLAYNGNPSGGSGVFSTHSWAQTGGSGSVSITNNNNGTANILGVSAGSVTLQYTVVDNQGCASITTSSITVLNCGSISCPASVTVCADPVTNTATVGSGTPGSNGYIDPTDTEAVAGDACGFTTGTFGRSGATSGGGLLVVMPTIVSLPAGTVFNAGNTVVSYSINDGCQQTQTCAFTVVVRRTPLPFFNQTAITICDGAGVNLASYARDSRNVAKRYDFYEDVGGILQFRGTATATSGNVNFGQNVWVNPAGNPNVPVIHTYYLVATNTFNNGPSCGQQGGPLTVTVIPKPAPPAVPADLSICPGDAVVVPAFSTASPAGVTQFNWSNSNPAIGLAANGTANALPGTAFSFTAAGNTTGSPISATILVQAVANNCVSNPATFNIVLRPAPVGVPASPAICSGQPVNHSLQAAPAATFSWVAASNTSVSGESLTPQSGPTITDVLTNNTSSVQTVVYTVTPTSTDGCEGANFTVSVTVNPLPVLTPGLSVSVCAGENASLALTDTGGIATGFSWVQQSLPANVLQLSGAANGAGSPISGAFIVGGTLPATINYSVTPSTASCPGAPATASIVVNPGTVNTLTLSACETTAGSGIGTLNLAAALPGASFYSATLSPIGSSYTGAATTVYAFAPAANPPCLVQTVISIVVSPKPTANVLPANNMICLGSDVLLNGNPAGGSPAYLHNWIAPAGAAFVQIADNGNGTATVTGIAAGMATLQYTVSDQNNCSASASASVEVKAAPGVIAFANQLTDTVAVCQGSPISLSSSIVPVQGTLSLQWTGPSFSSGQNNPAAFSLATPGLYSYMLEVNDSNGCAASDTVVVEVVAPKFAGNANNYGGIYCIADMTPFNLFDILAAQAAPQVVDPTGIWTGVIAPANGNLGTIVPAVFAGIGNYSFFYTVSNPAGCGTSTTAIVNLDIVDCTVPIIYAQPKVFLQGPYNTGTGLMNDGLRSQGLVPLTEPYSNLGYLFTGGGGESIPVTVLNVTGPNAIVDWVVVELRSATNPATVIFSRSALLQRDGDVVDLDGVSPVGFLGIFPGTFHLAVKHRNHLGVMSATAQAFPLYVPVPFDYTQAANPPFGGLPGSSLQLTASLLLVYGGDASFNGQVQNDDVVNFWAVQVGLSGYLRADYNMDGQVQNSDQVFIWTPNSGRGSQIPQ